MSDGYTVAQAARRMGKTTASVRLLIKADELVAITGTDPLQVRREEVDARRAEELAKFSDVIDATEFHGGRPLPAELLAEWLRTSAGAQELLDEGVEKIRRSHRLLADALTAALPAPC